MIIACADFIQYQRVSDRPLDNPLHSGYVDRRAVIKLTCSKLSRLGDRQTDRPLHDSY